MKINVSETHDFLDPPRETGTHRREVENGVVHTFTVEDGKMVKHEAVDRDGKPLRTSRLRMESTWDDPPTAWCYICTNGGDTWGPGGDDVWHQCYKAPCDF